MTDDDKSGGELVNLGMAKKKKKATRLNASAAYKKRKRKPQVAEEPAEVYLTKRTLVRAIKKGSKNLTADAIEAMGYTVIVKDIGEERWVVKIDGEGNVLEKITQIRRVKSPRKIVLD